MKEDKRIVLNKFVQVCQIISLAIMFTISLKMIKYKQEVRALC